MSKLAKPIAVIGGGFSGLTAAYYLQKQGFAVTVYERQSYYGGLIQTQKQQGVKVETAANGLLNSFALEQLCEDIGLQLQKPSVKAKKRFIFWKKPQRWPLQFFETLSFAKFIFLFFFLRKRVAPQAGESMQQWGIRVVGPAFVYKMLQPALQGIYAGDVRELSATLILSNLFARTKLPKPQTGRGTRAPAGGMGELIRALQSTLSARGVGFKNLSVNDLRQLPEKHVVLATNFLQAAALLQNSAPQFAQDLARIPALNLLRVTVGWPDAHRRVGGFGILFAANMGFRALGVLSNSEIFPEQSSLLSETWMFGGAADPGALDLSDTALRMLILGERHLLFSEHPHAQVFVPIRWPKALPHYTIGLERLLEQYRNRDQADLAQQGIFLTGNYLGTIGLSGILQNNLKLAEQIGTSLGETK